MTIRPRVVRALRDARTRLRDAAAASHATASAARDGAQLALVREQDRLEDFLDETPAMLSAVQNVHELSRVAEHTGVYRLDVIAAAKDHDAAIAEADAAAGRLRARARELRRAEKLVERVEEYRAKAEAKAEQKAQDDMAGRRS